MGATQGVTLDKVIIDIEVGASKANSTIENLSNSLGNLKASTKGGFASLSRLADHINKLKTAINSMDDIGSKMDNITDVITSLKQLSDIKSPKSLGYINRTLKDLNESSSYVDNISTNLENIEPMFKSLQTLSAIDKASGLGYTTAKLAELAKVSDSIGGVVEKSQQLPQLVAPLQSLSQIQTPRALGYIVKNIENLERVLQAITPTTLENVTRVSNELSKALEPLAIKMASIGQGYSAISQLARTYGVQISNLRDKHNSLSKTMDKLSRTGSKVLNVFKGITSVMLQIGKSGTKQFDSLNSKIKQVYLSLLGTRTLFTAVRKAISEYSQMDAELTKQTTNLWRALGAQLAPALELALYLFKQFTRVIYSFVYAVTGIDLIARANAKAMASWAKSASDTLGALQKFDDLNVAEFGSGSDDNSLINLDKIDLSPIQWIIDATIKIKNALLTAFDTGRWKAVGSEIANLLNESSQVFNNFDILTKLDKITTEGGSFVNGFLEGLNGADIGKTIQTILLVIPRTINTMLKTVKWDIIGSKVSDTLKSINFEEIITEWANRFILLVDGLQTAFLNMDTTTIANSLSQVIKGILGSINTLLTTIKWSEIGLKLHDVILEMDWKGIFKTIGNILLNALAGIGDLIAGSIFGTKFETKASSVFAGLGVTLGGILITIFGSTLLTKLSTLVSKLFKTSGIGKIKSSGISDSLSKFEFSVPNPKTVLKGIGDLAIIIAGVGTLILAIGELTRIPGFEKYTTAGLSIVVDVFKGLGSILAPLVTLSAGVVGLGFASPVTVASGIGGLAEIIAGIPLLLLAIGELTRLTNFEKYTKAGLAIVVDVFEGLQQVIVPIGEISLLVVGLGIASPVVVVSGIIGLATIVSSFIGLLDELSNLYNNEGFKVVVRDGGEALKLLGSALGKGIGAIKDGMIDASTENLPEYGTRISEFAKELEPFLEIAKTIDKSTAENTSILANGILNITAANVLDGIGTIATLGTKQTLKQFGENLQAFGTSFKAYADSIKGISSDTLESSTSAAKSIAEFAATLKPHDGVWQKIVGDNKLSDFGAELANFGANFVIYARTISAITNDQYNNIDKHLASIDKIIAVYNTIPKSFTSTTNTVRGQSSTTTMSMLQTFGTELTKFGTNMATYYDKIKNIDSDKMDSVTFALQNLIVSLEAINKYGLTNTLTEFSNSLKSSASSIVSFFSSALSPNVGYNTGYNFGKNIGQGISNALKNTNFPSLRLFGLNSNSQIGSYKIQSYETGTNEVPYEGLYHLHEGEAVVPKKYNPALGNGTDTELGQKIDTLISIVNDMNFTNVVNIGNKTLYKQQEKYNRKQNDKYGTTVNI